MRENTRGRKLATAALLITAANFLGKLLGFLRDILISNYYGATAQTDAFFLAISIPTILIGIFTSSADSVIVPQYSQISKGDGSRREADRYFSNIITILTTVATCVAVFTLLMPQGILFLFAPTFHGEQLSMACTYLRLFSFAGLFHIWYCFFCAYLLCYERTGPRTVLSFTTNLGVVLALVCIHDTKMYALSIAYLIGIVLNAVIPVIASLRTGYRYYPGISLKNHSFPEFSRLFLPVMGSALLADLLMYCDRFLTSFLPVGSLSALNYASKIVSIFDNILIIGVGAILLPVLTRFQIEEQMERFRFTVSAVCFCIILVLFPIALLCILYSDELVAVLYLRGAFTAKNAEMVSAAFQAYGLQVFLISLNAIFTKVFHSTANTKWPFRVSIATFFTNVVLSVVLMQHFGVFGIALATTASIMLGCGLHGWRFQKQYGFSADFISPWQVVRFLCCTVSIFLVHALIPAFSSPLVRLIVSGGGAFIAYAVLAAILFRKEITLCIRTIR